MWLSLNLGVRERKVTEEKASKGWKGSDFSASEVKPSRGDLPSPSECVPATLASPNTVSFVKGALGAARDDLPSPSTRSMP